MSAYTGTHDPLHLYFAALFVGLPLLGLLRSAWREHKRRGNR